MDTKSKVYFQSLPNDGQLAGAVYTTPFYLTEIEASTPVTATSKLYLKVP
jgi:hypothetical protein